MSMNYCFLYLIVPMRSPYPLKISKTVPIWNIVDIQKNNSMALLAVFSLNTSCIQLWIWMSLYFLSSVHYYSSRYHSNTCYRPYMLWADRKEKSEMKIDTKMNETEAENDDIISSSPKLKRIKSNDLAITKHIIHNMKYHNKSKKMFGLCE